MIVRVVWWGWWAISNYSFWYDVRLAGEVSIICSISVSKLLKKYTSFNMRVGEIYNLFYWWWLGGGRLTIILNVEKEKKEKMKNRGRK